MVFLLKKIINLSSINISSIYNFLFYSLILTTPLIVFGISMGGFSLRISRILIIFIIPLMFLKLIYNLNLLLRDKFSLYGFLPYLAYTTITALWSPNVETGTALQRLGGLYEIYMLYMIFIVADLNPERFIVFIKYYVLSAVIPICFSVWQFANSILHFSSSEIPFDNYLISGKYELLEGRVFVAGGGFSRISSTFAEPVIFASFICTVLLFSFLLNSNNYFSIITIRFFQILAFLIMILSISKLAIISFILGILIICIKGKLYRKYIFIFFLMGFLYVLSEYDMLFIFDRLFIETGHYELLHDSLLEIKKINFIIGEGIGSVPYGSFHRFVLSRIYESGVYGLIFVYFVSILPFKILFQKIYNLNSRTIHNICIGVIFAVIFGLHVYDYFIHLFPWVVIGAIMSLYNNELYNNLSQMKLKS